VDPAGGGLTYHWDFGDGGSGGGGQVGHVYATDGPRTATLTVKDVNGATDTDMISVNVTPAPAPSGTATLTGSVAVADPTGAPIPGVVIQRPGGLTLGVTGTDGMVELANFPTGVAVLLKLTASGYADAFVRIELADGLASGFFDAAMRPRNAASLLPDAAAGGSVVGEDGVSSTLPPNALVHANGQSATGAVNVAMTPIDVSGPEIGAFPGEFAGILPDGETTPIVSFGTAELIVSQNGEELQLAPGVNAVIELPIYGQGAAIDDEIPLWSLDEQTGLWVHEGIGIVVQGPSGPALRGSIGHLSWWNADLGFDPVGVRAQCIASSGVPFGVCVVRLISSGNGSFRWEQNIPFDGAGSGLPPNSTINASARAVGLECILLGSTEVPTPAPGATLSIPVECPGSDATVRLAYGDRIEAEIAAGGEVDEYVFAGTTGDDIRLDLESTGLEGIYALRDPNGATISTNTFASPNDRHVFATLASTGDYTVEVTGEFASEVGTYTIGLDLHESQPATPISLPADLAGDIGFTVEVDAYTFTGTAGDEIMVAAVRDATGAGPLSGAVIVRSPSNAILMEDAFSNAVAGRALRLPADGQYTVEVSGTSGLPGSYLLDVRGAPSVLIQDGDELVGSLGSQLEVDAIRFTGAAGDLVRLDFVRTGAGEDMRARVHGPSGSEAANQVFDEDPIRHAFVTLEAGEYRTSIHSRFNTAGGEYRIGYSVYVPQPAMAITYGDALVESIEFPVETDAWLFNATLGDEIQLNVTTAAGSTLQGDVRLLAPSGGTVTSGSYNQALGFGSTLTLNETGQYRIEVDGDAGFVPGDYEISLQLSGGAGNLPFGQLTQATMDLVGEIDEYTFAGNAGDFVRLHVATAAGSTLRGFIELEDPAGTQLLPIGNSFHADLSYNRVVELPATGEYTVVLTATQNAPGAYQVGLGDGIGRRDMTFRGGLASTGSASSDGFSIRRIIALSTDDVLGVGSEKMRVWSATTGELVPTFGTNGVVDFLADAGLTWASAAAVQPDGRIVVAGLMSGDWMVLRYDPNGSQDLSFGTSGVVTIEMNGRTDLANEPKAIRFVPDGADFDIIVGGEVKTGTVSVLLALARLNSDGSFDTGFAGGAGFLIQDHGGVGEAMEVQSDGRIVMVGHAAQTVKAVRFMPDGTLDTSFGVGGTASISTAPLGTFIRGMVMRPDGRFIALGEVGSLDALAVGFTADGAPDATFGPNGNGIVSVDFGHWERFWHGVVDASGRIVLSGAMRLGATNGEGEAFVVRMNADGTLDSAFGIGGVVVEDNPDDGRGIAIDAQGRILVGGDRPSGSSFSVGNIIRLLIQ
jgi:uncharacterized delta-60 repeat protein